jgi:hypothetical protein
VGSRQVNPESVGGMRYAVGSAKRRVGSGRFFSRQWPRHGAEFQPGNPKLTHSNLQSGAYFSLAVLPLLTNSKETELMQ